VWFTVSVKAQLESCLPLVPAASLLLYPNRLASFLGISLSIIVLK
jgi:hypothetical protein